MRRAIDSGMTLIELLIAMMVSVMIVGVVTTAFIISAKINIDTRSLLTESHDAQLVAAYLPADLISAGGTLDSDPATPTGCDSSPPGRYNVAALTWTEAEGTDTRRFNVAYRARQAAGEWQLTRYACDALSATPLSSVPATTLVVAHTLRPVSTDADLPVVSVTSSLVTMRITDASSYTYAVSGSRRGVAASIAAAAASPSPSPTSSPPGSTRPAATRLELLGDATGTVRLEVEFSLPIEEACKSAFTLSGLPVNRGTWTGVAGLSSDRKTAIIAIDRGANDANTAVDALRVGLNGETASCSAASIFPEAAPIDKAAPVLLRTQTTNSAAGTVRRLNDLDTLTLTFSEPIANLPSQASVELVGQNNNNADLLRVPGILTGFVNLGSDTYVTNNKTATALGTWVQVGARYSAAVAIQGCSGNSCATSSDMGQGVPAAVVTFTPVNSFADAASNSLQSVGLAAVPLSYTNFAAF